MIHPLYLKSPLRKAQGDLGRILRLVSFQAKHHFGNVNDGANLIHSAIVEASRLTLRVPVPIQINGQRMEDLLGRIGEHARLHIADTEDGRKILLIGFPKSRSGVILIHDGLNTDSLGLCELLPFAFEFNRKIGTLGNQKISLSPGPARHTLPGKSDFRVYARPSGKSVSLITPATTTTVHFDVTPLMNSLAGEVASWVNQARKLPDIWYEPSGIGPMSGAQAPDKKGAFAVPSVVPHQSHDHETFDKLQSILVPLCAHLLRKWNIEGSYRLTLAVPLDPNKPWLSFSFDRALRGVNGLIAKAEIKIFLQILWEMLMLSGLPVSPIDMSRAGMERDINWFRELSYLKNGQGTLYAQEVLNPTLLIVKVDAEFVVDFSAHKVLQISHIENRAGITIASSRKTG